MTKTKTEVYWIPSALRKPEPDTQVLVAGGIAMWDGTNWISLTEPYIRIIQRPVKWWAELPDPPTE